MLIEQKKCQVCGVENWESLDYLRDNVAWYRRDFREENEPVGFKICKECGFLTYDYVDEKRLSESYNRQRPIMIAQNIVTCNRKNEYHKKMLLPHAKLDYKVLDVGCAQGATLNFLKENGLKAENLYGTEHSRSFANFARFEYGLKNITEEIDYTQEYDIIMLYHVFEHIQNPSDFLQKIKAILKKDGFLYVSIPRYLDRLEETSGSFIEDFEEFYHLNHVNVFSLQSFKNIMHKNGLKITEYDDKMYGYTAMFVVDKEQPIIPEDYKPIIEKLEKQKKAIECMKKKDFEGAIAIDKTYIDAYIYLALNSKNMKDYNAQHAIFENALVANPDATKILNQLARLYYQFDETTPEKNFYSNNIKKSEEIFERLLREKPGNEDLHYFLGLINSKYKKDYSAALYHMKRFLEINPTKFNEAYSLISWIYNVMEKQ